MLFLEVAVQIMKLLSENPGANYMKMILNKKFVDAHTHFTSSVFLSANNF